MKRARTSKFIKNKQQITSISKLDVFMFVNTYTHITIYIHSHLIYTYTIFWLMKSDKTKFILIYKQTNKPKHTQKYTHTINVS